MKEHVSYEQAFPGCDSHFSKVSGQGFLVASVQKRDKSYCHGVTLSGRGLCYCVKLNYKLNA